MTNGPDNVKRLVNYDSHANVKHLVNYGKQGW